jgi:hypothetical protein
VREHLTRVGITDGVVQSVAIARSNLGYTGPRCESGWTGDRCPLPLYHEGDHDNSTPELTLRFHDHSRCEDVVRRAIEGQVCDDGCTSMEQHDRIVYEQTVTDIEELADDGFPGVDLFPDGCIDTPYTASPRSETYWSS